jgi:CDP-paratose 2-epimerase
MRVLILGGAGFVGSSLALLFRDKYPSAKIVAFDNLRRRGSELNLPKFKNYGIDFVHGDIRSKDDLSDLEGNFDLVVEASAEPSVHAGVSGRGIDYLTQTNLVGTLNFLEFGRKRAAQSIFLSTSRVYSIPALRAIPLKESALRVVLGDSQDVRGLSEQGISESFPTVGQGFRSLYGSTKLASELFIEEYAATFEMSILINRCGVIAGPGQYGKTDQGVFTLWVARHYFGGGLSYTGFGGLGKQVRDLLHPRDLFDLMERQWPQMNQHKGCVFAVGGGLANSVSLLKYTQICQELAGRSIEIKSIPDTASVDIPWYVTDSSKAQSTFGWVPQRSPSVIAGEIVRWMKDQETDLKPLFS